MKRLGLNQVRVLLALNTTPQSRRGVQGHLKAQGHPMTRDLLEQTLDSLIMRGLVDYTELHGYTLGESAELPQALAYARDFAAPKPTTLAEGDAMLKRATT